MDGRILNSTNVSFMSSIWAVKPGTLEEKVQILWNGILNTWFPPTQPYKIGIKSAVLTNNTEPDGVVFEIRFNMQNLASSGDLTERQIFMLECKRAREDTPKGWDSAENQLLNYIAANSNDNECSGMYGACAVGKKVVFYEWTRASGQLTAISGELDMDVGDNRPLVEAMLDHVKQHGWIRTDV